MNYQEFVFRPSRRVQGKSVKGRLYVGQYFLKGMTRPKRVCLDTPDKSVAQQRLRAIVIERQKEADGLLAPKAQREAVTVSLDQHVKDYKRNLQALGRAKVHVQGTIQRIERPIREAGWRTLVEVTIDAYSSWWAGLEGSAKTKKEYQVSMRAFLNWLVLQGRLESNALQKLTLIARASPSAMKCGRCLTQFHGTCE